MKINVICVSMLFNAGIQSELSSNVPFQSILLIVAYWTESISKEQQQIDR